MDDASLINKSTPTGTIRQKAEWNMVAFDWTGKLKKNIMYPNI